MRFYKSFRELFHKGIQLLITRQIQRQEKRLIREGTLKPGIAPRILYITVHRRYKVPKKVVKKLLNAWNLERDTPLDFQVIRPLKTLPPRKTLANLFGLKPFFTYSMRKALYIFFMIRQIGHYEYVYLETLINYNKDLFLEELLMAYFQKIALDSDQIREQIQVIGKQLQDPDIEQDLEDKLNYLEDHSSIPHL